MVWNQGVENGLIARLGWNALLDLLEQKGVLTEQECASVRQRAYEEAEPAFGPVDRTETVRPTGG